MSERTEDRICSCVAIVIVLGVLWAVPIPIFWKTAGTVGAMISFAIDMLKKSPA